MKASIKLFVAMKVYVIIDKTSRPIRSCVACRFSRYQLRSLSRRDLSVLGEEGIGCSTDVIWQELLACRCRGQNVSYLPKLESSIGQMCQEINRTNCSALNAGG